jgi:hypothetical protein
MAFKYYRANLKNALRLLNNNSKESARKRKKKGRIEEGEHDINLAFLETLWINQNGRCYYSNIPMNFSKNEWRVSIERVNNEKGYVKDNVVLCCLEFNTRSQWTQDKVDEMLSILDKNIEDNLEYYNCFTKIPRRRKYQKFLEIDVNGVKHYRCGVCYKIKSSKEFGSHKNDIYRGCRECTYSLNKQLLRNPNVMFNKILNGAKNSTKIREQKTQVQRDNSFDIDIEFLHELYVKQRGLCEYSGLPLQFGSYKENPWVLSLERKDPLQGYRKDNVCFVCIEFNTTDFHVIYGNADYGTSGMSALKFQVFLNYVKLKKGLITQLELDTVLHLQKQTSTYTSKDLRTISRTPTNTKSTEKEQSKHIASIITKAKKLYGEVFKITSPSGRSFIGTTPNIFQQRQTYFYNIRLNGNTHVLREIERYGEESIHIEKLVVCLKDTLDQYEQHFIREYDTFLPNGLNLVARVSPEIRNKISKTLINKTKRLGHSGQELPKYIKYVNWTDRQGYSIVSHPKTKKRDFVSNQKTLDEKYQQAIIYLQKLEE